MPFTEWRVSLGAQPCDRPPPAVRPPSSRRVYGRAGFSVRPLQSSASLWGQGWASRSHKEAEEDGPSAPPALPPRCPVKPLLAVGLQP